MSSKKCQYCIPFSGFTYPEMQRKHIPRVYEYQSSTSIWLMFDIKCSALSEVVSVFLPVILCGSSARNNTENERIARAVHTYILSSKRFT